MIWAAAIVCSTFFAGLLFFAVQEMTAVLKAMQQTLLGRQQNLTNMQTALSDIETDSELSADAMQSVADIAHVHQKYDTFPLGRLLRPLIGSEAD